MTTKNVKRKENFSQVCVWPATLVEGKIAAFEEFFLKEFGTRVQYLEEIKTLPDMEDGRPEIDSGDRNDVFFAVHKDDIGKFAGPRFKIGVRWIEDVLGNEDTRGNGSIYPQRVREYRTWNYGLGTEDDVEEQEE